MSQKKRQLALELLGQITFAADPTLLKVRKDWLNYCGKIEKWYQSEGNQGVKRAKDIYGWTVRYAFGEEPEPLEFTKSDGIGRPLIVKFLLEFIEPGKTDPGRLGRILTLLGIFNLYKGLPTDRNVYDAVETIQNSKLPDTFGKIKEEFDEFLELFIKKYPNHPVVKELLRPLPVKEGFAYLNKKGPHGYLLESAHMDAIALHKSGLANTVIDLLNEVASCALGSFTGVGDGDQFLTDPSLLKGVKCDDVVGKLTALPDKGGKVRFIASPDYWTQHALKPVHDWLMSVVDAFPQDCTYNQLKGVENLKRWTEEGRFVASFDHSSCTDLFPREVQRSIIEAGKNANLSLLWESVISNRDFSVSLPSDRKTLKKVRWSVGQPMGALSSWPAMAVAHHMLVLFAHYKANRKRLPKALFNKYSILGDDVVISDRSVADQYLLIVKAMGMKINMTKSHISGHGTTVPSVGEFAKKLVFKGEYIHVLSANLVYAAKHDWRVVPTLLRELVESKTIPIRLKKVVSIIKSHWPKEAKWLERLAVIPKSLGGGGYRNSQSLTQVVAGDTSLPAFLFHIMDKKAAKSRDRNREGEEIAVVLESIQLDGRLLRYHPLLHVYRDFESRDTSRNFTDNCYNKVPYIDKIKDTVEGITPAEWITLLEGSQSIGLPLRPLLGEVDQEEISQKEISVSWKKAFDRAERYKLEVINQEVRTIFLGRGFDLQHYCIIDTKSGERRDVSRNPQQLVENVLLGLRTVSGN